MYQRLVNVTTDQHGHTENNI